MQHRSGKCSTNRADWTPPNQPLDGRALCREGPAGWDLPATDTPPRRRHHRRPPPLPAAPAPRRGTRRRRSRRRKSSAWAWEEIGMSAAKAIQAGSDARNGPAAPPAQVPSDAVRARAAETAEGLVDSAGQGEAAETAGGQRAGEGEAADEQLEGGAAGAEAEQGGAARAGVDDEGAAGDVALGAVEGELEGAVVVDVGVGAAMCRRRPRQEIAPEPRPGELRRVTADAGIVGGGPFHRPRWRRRRRSGRAPARRRRRRRRRRRGREETRRRRGQSTRARSASSMPWGSLKPAGRGAGHAEDGRGRGGGRSGVEIEAEIEERRGEIGGAAEARSARGEDEVAAEIRGGVRDRAGREAESACADRPRTDRRCRSGPDLEVEGVRGQLARAGGGEGRGRHEAGRARGPQSPPRRWPGRAARPGCADARPRGRGGSSVVRRTAPATMNTAPPASVASAARE